MLSWPARCGAVGSAVAAVVLAVACGSEGGGNSGFSQNDAGVDSGSPFGDAGHDAPTDAPPFGDSGGGDAHADSGVQPTTALIVHASPDMVDARFCWSVGGKVTQQVSFPGTGTAPASNYAGVPRGGATAFGDATELTGGDVTFYAIDAANLAVINKTGLTCDKLICSATGCLRPTLDYWTVATISGGLPLNRASVVALSGCRRSIPNFPTSTSICGPTWNAVDGNLHMDVLTLPDAFGAPGQIAVEAAQLSPSVGGLAGDAAAAVVTFGAQDAGDAAVVAQLGVEGDHGGNPQFLEIGTNLSAFGDVGFAVDLPSLAADAGTTHLWMSLAQSQQLVDPTQDPVAFFGQPRPYLVAVIGTPGAPSAFTGAGTYDGSGLHLLVVPASAQTPAPVVGGEPPVGDP